MKIPNFLAALTVLLFFGCVYDSPLIRDHTIPIDPAVLGLWEPIPKNGEQVNSDERMLVMKYSDTEYFIHHPIGKNGIYWRGYPIKIGDTSCVQLQALGTEKGPVPIKEKELYNVASYELSNGELIVKTLNTGLISKKLKGSEAIKKAFLEHKDDKNLFQGPGRFKKIPSDE